MVEPTQSLDALKDIKKTPDSDVNVSLKIMRSYISKLSVNEQNRLSISTPYQW